MNYPDGANFEGTVYDQPDMTVEQAEAEAALDWMDSILNRIYLMLVEGAITHNLTTTKADAREAMDYFRDVISDLFGKDRARLTAIAGERPYPKTEQLIQALKPPTREELERILRPVPTNPETRRVINTGMSCQTIEE